LRRSRLGGGGFIDAARDFRARTQSRGQKARPAVRQSGIVLVRNSTAVDLTRMMVVALGSPVIAPASRLQGHHRRRDHPGIDKKGWEYVWVRYADSEDAVAMAIAINIR
ncbi:MAG: hypothetical protein KAX78_07825, partial [Phycisphaerae bacterium]|nr:hypothetical protein [Phycisphaerae bacterium]